MFAPLALNAGWSYMEKKQRRVSVCIEEDVWSLGHNPHVPAALSALLAVIHRRDVRCVV